MRGGGGLGREFLGGGGLRISLQDEGIFSLLSVCLFLVKGLEVGEEEKIIQDCFDKLMLITRPVLYLSYIVRQAHRVLESCTRHTTTSTKTSPRTRLKR